MDAFYILFAQSAIVAFQGAWLTVAVQDNIRNPRLNERGFASVLGMDLVKQDEDVYRAVADRQIKNPKVEKALFRALVAAEVVVSALLWIGALALLLAAFGFVSQSGARELASIAVLGFVAIWASLLIGGQWFWYRIGMLPAMQAHFFLVIWGTATLAFFAAGP